MRPLAAVLLASTLLLLALPSTAGASGRGRAAHGPPRLQARAWALIDARTGETLVAHAAMRRLPIASTTKLMTAYLALAELPLRKRVRAVPYSAIPGESLLGLSAGEQITVRDLLYGLILRSGNDAALTLADAAAGSEARFVRQMNLRAAALGLADTHYANPIGLDQPGNHSTAEDLLTLARRLLGNPAFARIAASRTAVLHSLRPSERIYTRNTLLLRAGWADGVKTGHTLGAGYVLVGSGRRRGVELISAVLGAPSESQRDSESLDLLDYGFSLYRRRRPLRAGAQEATASIRFSGGNLPLLASRTVAIGLRRDQSLSVDVHAPAEVDGPVRRGARIGTALVLVDGRPAARVPLRAARSIPEAGAFDKGRTYVSEHPAPLAAGAFVILMGAASLRLLRRRRRRPK